MVTSAGQGEGKTTVAVDLSHAIAVSGRRVVLVELDLRRPSFGRHFDLRAAGGVTAALLGRAPVSELVQQPVADLPNLHVLPAGALPPNPAELLEAPAVDAALRELLADEETLLVVDTPPLLPVADAQVLLNQPVIDATLIVARERVTTRDQARRTRLILDGHVVVPLGLVVTGHSARDVYGYGDYQAGDAAAEEISAAPLPPGPAPAMSRRRSSSG
jgi:capsular exopolysaccharide synthesis family protein